MNLTSSPYDCTNYSVGDTGGLVNNGIFMPAQLFVTQITDEDGNVSYTFTDKLDRLLLERRMKGGEAHDTYYVYDRSNRLCFVLQPMYQTTPDLDRYSFQYRYDGHDNCVYKKLPGAQPTEYVYDSNDRMVFSQDGNRRLLATGNWTYYKYDGFGRLTEQGLCTNKVTASGTTVHIRNYYDDYSFVGSTGFPAGSFVLDTSGYGKGFLTGSVITVLGSGTQLYAAYYYDIKGRMVKTVQSNLLGGYDVTSTTYTFTDNPSTVTHTHTASGKPTRTEVYTYSYDHADRVSKVEHTLGGTKVTLATYGYDNLGRLQSKSLHGSAANKLTYAYNVRSWLTGISGSKFTQNLYYNTGNGTAKYNGSISSMTWQAGDDSTVRGYKFTYDGLDRIQNAIYGETASLSTNINRFSENVSEYDKNGNIKSLQRYGRTGASAYGMLDNLTYTLNGNQLTRVDDAVTASAYNGGFEFKDGVKQSNEYAYDANGNLTKDLNKGITDIQYNCLNLPSVVTFSDGSTITYTYAADGTKLKTVHKIGGTTTTTDYCGNVIYENGVQKLLLTEEGYVTLSDSKYHYYLKDHQGNNRVVINQSGTVEETNHYYPFGGVFASTGNAQPYKYNGKELDTKKGLNWYDYGARHYDAALGRFTTNDPLAEKYFNTGLYAYCLNNPVRFIDPTGGLVSPIYDESGFLLGTDDEGLQGDAIIMNKSNFKQGMSHSEALSYSLGYGGLVDDEARSNYVTSYTSLKDRPDYDGYLTKDEADTWWRSKTGEPLFVDQSKIELHGVNTSSFSQNKSIYKNFIWRLTNTGKVYGTLKMTLIDGKTGKVFIGSEKYMDKYDFTMDNRPFRNFATWVGRPGRAGDGKDFLIYSYGYAIVPVVK